jgi:hypothetical protein
MRGVRCCQAAAAFLTSKLIDRFEKRPKLFDEFTKTPESLVKGIQLSGIPPNTAAMKLNVKNIRYLSSDDWRVLTAVCAPIPRVS